jgi:dihydrofolate reductase
MGKLGTFTFISIDGYYKDINNDFSWNKHGPEENAFAGENVNASPGGTTLVFGRVTYEMMASFWPTPMASEMLPDVARGMNNAHKIVFSKTLKKASWENTTVVNGNLIKEIKKLKDTTPHDLTILGSGSIVTQLAGHDLIDYYQIMLNPIAIGGGTPLFTGVNPPVNLKLTNTRIFKSGVVLLCYEPIR